jgi:pimeloyl-ACP methyl ester carboxylesterase
MFDGKSIVFFVRGIAGNPDNFLEWEQRAADHTIIQYGIPARAISYHTDFWSVWMKRRYRAQRFSKVLRKYSVRDYRITIVAHSEGTVVALDAMRLAGWPRVEQVHLICGACDSDFERTGLNRALRAGQVGRVTCYNAGRDWAMCFENLILGRALFGISGGSWPLGLVGPRNVSSFLLPCRVTEVTDPPWRHYGHSECFDGENFERTMRQILGGQT